MTDKSYTPDEFAELVGSTNRNIRYLASEGMIPRGRGAPPRVTYAEEHLAAYREYQRLAGLGFSVRQIQDLVRLAPGTLEEVFGTIRSIATIQHVAEKETTR